MYKNLIPTSHVDEMIDMCKKLIPSNNTGQWMPVKLIHWATYSLIERLLGMLYMIPGINNNISDYRFLNHSVAHLARALALDMIQALHYVDVWESNIHLPEAEIEQKMNDAAQFFTMDRLESHANWLKNAGLLEEQVINILDGSVEFDNGKASSINNSHVVPDKISMNLEKYQNLYSNLLLCYQTLNKICHFSLLGMKMNVTADENENPITYVFSNIYFHLIVLATLESAIHEEASSRKPIIERINELRAANTHPYLKKGLSPAD